MGASKGSRKEHRNAAVLRRRVATKPHEEAAVVDARAPVFVVNELQRNSEARRREIFADLEAASPRPTSEQRAYANWNLIGAIYWLVIGGLIALGALAIAFVAIMKTAGF